MSALVFVYGTLMRGGSNHDVLVRLGARFVSPGESESPRTLVDLGPYPALLPVDPERDRTTVHGELYAVEDSALVELDAFEGCPSLYRRERIALATAIEAFTYVLARRVPASARELPSGRYEGRGKVLDQGADARDLEPEPEPEPEPEEDA